MAGTITTSTIQNDTSSPPTFRNSTREIGTLCRAWVNFNGTGTVAIRASFNVSSITDNGTGDYTVNFTNAMPDSSYSAQWSMECISNAGGWLTQISDYTTTSVKLFTRPYASGNFDSPTNSVAVFR
jgi:hypothetical protein